MVSGETAGVPAAPLLLAAPTAAPPPPPPSPPTESAFAKDARGERGGGEGKGGGGEGKGGGEEEEEAREGGVKAEGGEEAPESGGEDRLLPAAAECARRPSPGNSLATSAGPVVPATLDSSGGPPAAPLAWPCHKEDTGAQDQLRVVCQAHQQPHDSQQSVTCSSNPVRTPLLDTRDPRAGGGDSPKKATSRLPAGPKPVQTGSPGLSAVSDFLQGPPTLVPLPTDTALAWRRSSPPAIPPSSAAAAAAHSATRDRSVRSTSTNEALHVEEEWEGSDDKDDLLDADESFANSPSVSGHSINLDSLTQGDLRRLAMESTDTLEQLAKKANAAAAGTAADRASSLFVTSWLIENYEVEEDHNVPRISLYSHYLKYCQQQGVRPVNSASFGKLIRSVFPDLKTRRLGTRGQSKYHYCGIRVRKPGRSGTDAGVAAASARMVPVMMLDTQGYRSDMTHYRKSFNDKPGAFASERDDEQQRQQSYDKEDQPPPTNTLLRGLPNLPESIAPSASWHADAMAFVESYRGHCQDILDYVEHMRFGSVEHIVMGFWIDLPPQHRELLKSDHIVNLIYKTDAVLYDTVVGLMMPNVLQPMPLAVMQAIRLFARSLNMWLHSALAGYPPVMVAKKIEVAGIFSGQLRRYTSLNHLVRAAQSIFLDQGRLRKMLRDWSEVDFDSIRDQASWVCECNKADVMRIMEIEFPQLLASGSRLENWTEWISGIVDRFLTESMETKSYIYTARHLLLKWSFYASLAMRDLTLRSAESFGSFHLVRLLYDEYLFYFVEQKIANHHMKASLEKSPTGAATTTTAASASPSSSSAAGGRATAAVAAGSSPAASAFRQQQKPIDQTTELGGVQRRAGPSQLAAEPHLSIQHTPYPPLSQAQEIALGGGGGNNAYPPIHAAPPVVVPAAAALAAHPPPEAHNRQQQYEQQHPFTAAAAPTAAGILYTARSVSPLPPSRGRKRRREQDDGSAERTAAPAPAPVPAWVPPPPQPPPPPCSSAAAVEFSQPPRCQYRPWQGGEQQPSRPAAVAATADRFSSVAAAVVDWPAVPAKLGIENPRTLMISSDAEAATAAATQDAERAATFGKNTAKGAAAAEVADT